MKAVILCGGKGTRIKGISELLPKPMVPIGGMDDQTTAAAGLGGMGRVPEMILPPPRREPA